MVKIIIKKLKIGIIETMAQRRKSRLYDGAENKKDPDQPIHKSQSKKRLPLNYIKNVKPLFLQNQLL